MIEFKLNKAEEDYLNEIIKALSVLYGEYDELKRTYVFTHSSIGIKSEVILKGYVDKNKIFEINKDITDYTSW